MISNSLQERFNSSSLVRRINTKPSIMVSCGQMFDYSAVSYNFTVALSLLPNTCPNKTIVSSYSISIEEDSTAGRDMPLQSALVEPIIS